MSGYQPTQCGACANKDNCNRSGKIYGKCVKFKEKRPSPPNSGSTVHKPEQIITHIHCDISKEFLAEYKAEIVNLMAEKLKNCFKDNYGYEGSEIKHTIEQIAEGIKK